MVLANLSSDGSINSNLYASIGLEFALLTMDQEFIGAPLLGTSGIVLVEPFA